MQSTHESILKQATKSSIFMSTYKKQCFSLPSSILYYIANNPTDSDMYERMIETCKFFYVKNPIVIISKLNYKGANKWSIVSRWLRRSFDFDNIDAKLWLKSELIISVEESGDQTITSKLCSRIFQSDVDFLRLGNQSISKDELIFLGSNASTLDFESVKITDSIGSIVPFQKIVEALPTVDVYDMEFDANSLNVFKNTFDELSKIGHLKDIHVIVLRGITQDIDFCTFYNFIKENKNIRFWIEFNEITNEAFKNSIDLLIAEIVAAAEDGSNSIYYPDMDHTDEVFMVDSFYKNVN